MSADNGIYILETSGPEYRVAHLQAIENLDYDMSRHCYTDDDSVRIENAREMFGHCKVLTSRDQAFVQAGQMLSECYLCEYGICYLTINKKF